MEFQTADIMQFIADLMLPFMRLSAMFVVMVGFGARTVPVMVRTFLTLIIAMLILPFVPPVEVPEIVSVPTFILIIKELIIGVAIGFISTMVLMTFVVAGQIVAMQTGLGFASIVDPVNGLNVTAVGQFYLILATLMFWSFDGHLSMIRMIVMSFEALPVNHDWWPAINYYKVASWGAWMFIVAVTLSLAPIVALLAVNLAFGVMSKAAPQLNVFTLGFSIAQITGLTMIWLTLGNFASHFEAQWQRAQQLMCELLQICSV